VARLGLVAAGRRSFAAPAAFLLAVTIAVVVVQSTRHHSSASPLVMSNHPVVVSGQGVGDEGARFYRVAAGDTLAAIATKTDVPLARLRTLNPRLQPTALFIGEKIRLR
jgi:LysM repeat protein